MEISGKGSPGGLNRIGGTLYTDTKTGTVYVQSKYPFGNAWRLFVEDKETAKLPEVTKKGIPAGASINVAADEQLIIFGSPVDIQGDLSGDGLIHFIVGDKNQVLVFDENGLPTNSKLKVKSNGANDVRINLKSSSYSSGDVCTGDFWIEEVGSNAFLKYKHSNGSIKSIQMS
jgi:hypothetical protein